MTITAAPVRRKWAALAFGVELTVVLVAAPTGCGTRVDPAPPAIDDFPDLFEGANVCPRPLDALAAARELEERARMRADRYAYDPRDGVDAVLGYREAEACYRTVRARHSVTRTGSAAAALIHRVNADYAAARLNLANALVREDWKTALGELNRLLLFTEDVRNHDYVDWLEKSVGRVAARAATP